MESCIRIVLVDDDPICHLITTKMIKRFTSHEVQAFANPKEALAELIWRASHAADKFPDLILLDIDMPRMDGWQFLDEFINFHNQFWKMLQLSCSHLPIIRTMLQDQKGIVPLKISFQSLSLRIW